MLNQFFYWSFGYLLYLLFFVNFISGRSILTKLVLGLPIFLPVVACYLFAPTANLIVGLFTAVFLYLVFFTTGSAMRKLFLSVPFLIPAILIYIFSPIYKILFAILSIVGAMILFSVMLGIAARRACNFSWIFTLDTLF